MAGPLQLFLRSETPFPQGPSGTGARFWSNAPFLVADVVMTLDDFGLRILGCFGEGCCTVEPSECWLKSAETTADIDLPTIAGHACSSHNAYPNRLLTNLRQQSS